MQLERLGLDALWSEALGVDVGPVAGLDVLDPDLLVADGGERA